VRGWSRFSPGGFALLRAVFDVIPVALPLLAPLERQAAAGTILRLVAVLGLSYAGHENANRFRRPGVPLGSYLVSYPQIWIIGCATSIFELKSGMGAQFKLLN
jgi:hypothetical protein